MDSHCYYCGASPALRSLKISPSFTAGNLVAYPHSEMMCDRCCGIMFGEIQRVWFYNGKGDRWVALYLRGVSQLWQGDKLLVPSLGESETHAQVSASGNVGKPATYRVLSHIPTRAEMRGWLLSPPEPPFIIAIAESGQKHILFLAQSGYSRDAFPVQFETDSLWIDRARFESFLGVYEQLLSLGFSKAEIDGGEYRSDRVAANYEQWQLLDSGIVAERCNGSPSRFLQLISYLAQRLDG